MVDTTPDTADAPAGSTSGPRAGATATAPEPRRRGRASSVLTVAALAAGAVLFLFPFYYMLVGSLQATPDTSIKGAFPTSGFTLDNYKDINSRVDLVGSLVNSGIFTGGVLLGTIVFGVL